MIKFFIKISLFIILFFNISNVLAGSIDFREASNATSKIKNVSIQAKSGNLETQINSTAKNIFKTLKIIIGGLLVIYIVYAGIMMIIAMGDDEEKLSSSKRSLRYAIIGLLFINIPGTLYDAFSSKRTSDDITSNIGNMTTIYDRNIFMNSGVFGNTLGGIITFLQISVVSIAIFIIVLSGIKIILAQSKEEEITEQKNKILWSLAGLIFIGIMEVWKNVVFTGDFSGSGKDLFSSLANLALFFAGPIAIFFLSLAGYYYITAAGNDEKIKKAKNIIINTVLATLILLGMYTFLLDLKDLRF